MLTWKENDRLCCHGGVVINATTTPRAVAVSVRNLRGQSTSRDPANRRGVRATPSRQKRTAGGASRTTVVVVARATSGARAKLVVAARDPADRPSERAERRRGAAAAGVDRTGRDVGARRRDRKGRDGAATTRRWRR